jgi:hypothetical protein
MLKRIAIPTALTPLLLLLLVGPAGAQAPQGLPAEAEVDRPAAAEEAARADSTGSAEADPASVEREPSGEEGEDEPADTAAPEFGVVAPSGLTVLRAYICKGIEQSEPTEAGKSFIPTPDGVLRLCCFSEIGGAAEPDTVSHVWYWGQREMARVPLRVRGTRWRTWSTKRIIDEWQGDWRVDIVDRDGFVLASLPFSVE